jgi:DivIVA domain-containing protein
VDQSTGADRSEAQAEETPDTKREARFSRPRSKTFLSEVSGVDFSMARRGYDRAAVDEYVERVTRIVVELESNRSPDAVIERALSDVGEETSAILRRARAAAEEIVEQGNAEAGQRKAAAQAEARDIRAEAEAYREQAKVAGENIIAEAKAKAEGRATAAEAEGRQIRADADRYREEAKREADTIVGKANEAAQQLVGRAEASAAETKAKAERHRDEIQGQIDRLAEQRHDLVEEVRAMADNLHRAADAALEHAAPRAADEPAE